MEGFYECKCKRGSHGNPLKDMCEPNLPRSAMLTIGTILKFLVGLEIDFSYTISLESRKEKFSS
jgi:hypothetical protein